MIFAHVIALDPTAAQAGHFRKACGVARLAYNWALAEWKRKYEAGERPSAYKLKIKWNEIRPSQFPFTLEVTKCAGSQAILNLGVAFGNLSFGRRAIGDETAVDEPQTRSPHTCAYKLESSRGRSS